MKLAVGVVPLDASVMVSSDGMMVMVMCTLLRCVCMLLLLIVAAACDASIYRGAWI